MYTRTVYPLQRIRVDCLNDGINLFQISHKSDSVKELVSELNDMSCDSLISLYLQSSVNLGFNSISTIQ